MPVSLDAFVRKWKISSLSELQSAQTHFNELCDLLNQPNPTDADPTGEFFCFNKALTKNYGGKGFADVWKRGYFAWEYKGRHKDLRAAYKQINDYREDLLNPPLLVVCDTDTFQIHTNFQNTVKRVYRFTLDDLGKNRITADCPLPPLDVLRALFGDFNVLRPDRTDAFVTQEAARLFATLAERLEIEQKLSATPRQIANFLIRVLFCIFADAIGLLPDHLFRRLLDLDRFYPRRFLVKLPQLFAAMSAPDGIFGIHNIRYFNGGLFHPAHTPDQTDDLTVVQLDKQDMAVLHKVAHDYNWAHVAPAIFGTLFERSLNKDRRSLIGAHYTGEEDILLLIEPVVMQPLRRRWADTQAAVLAAKSVILSEAEGPAVSHPTPTTQSLRRPKSPVILSEAEGPAVSHPTPTKQFLRSPKSPVILSEAEGPAVPPTPQTQSLLHSNPEAERLLAAFFDHLAAVRILDPACGSGNFLYVALRRLLDLWLEARDFAAEHQIQLAQQYALTHMPSPRQLLGIEVDDYAHRLASIVVWIGFLQWKHEHGVNEDQEPVLDPLETIEHADAILRYDAEGHPYEPTWPPADFIVGNPPFLGGKLLRRELGDTYIDDLFSLYAGRVRAESDLVVYWFEKARAHLEADRVARVGLLATQGIRGGANRAVLERIARTGNIFWAWSDRNWLLNGANVHISLIAFDRGTKVSGTLPATEPGAPPSPTVLPSAKVGPDATDPSANGATIYQLGAPSSPTVSPSAKVGSDATDPGANSATIYQLGAPSSPAVSSSAKVGSDATEPSANGATIYQPGAQPQVSAPHESQGLKARHIPRHTFLLEPETAPFLLNGEPVPAIHPDLTSGIDTTSALRLRENRGICFMGTTKVGPFDIDAETARKMLIAPLNPNGRSNADVVRPWVNATDITRRSRGMYIIDFGTSMSQQGAALYEMPFEYVKHHVLPERKITNRDLGDKPWWLHGRSRPELRAAVNGSPRYIATPSVSKHRIFVWLPARTLPDHAAFAFTRPDDYFFGVLHSRIHELWARAQGTQLREVESGFRYTPDSTFDTFPFPWPPADEPTSGPDLAKVEAIAAAARHLVALRDRWLNPPGIPEADLKKRTLTILYNTRPTWLADTHRALDVAVFAAYGWPLQVDGKDLTTPEILSRLLALNHERAAAQLASQTVKTPPRRNKVRVPPASTPLE